MIALTWWALLVAKIGVPATIVLLAYLGLCLYVAVDIAIGLGQHLRYQLWAKRKLQQLHQAPGARVVHLSHRLRRRRAEREGPDAAA